MAIASVPKTVAGSQGPSGFESQALRHLNNGILIKGRMTERLKVPGC